MTSWLCKHKVKNSLGKLVDISEMHIPFYLWAGADLYIYICIYVYFYM